MTFPGGDEERGRRRVRRISAATTTATTATASSSNFNANCNASTSRALTAPDSTRVSFGVDAVGQTKVARGAAGPKRRRPRYHRPAVKQLLGDLLVAVLAGEAERGELDGRESLLVGAGIEERADHVQAAVE